MNSCATTKKINQRQMSEEQLKTFLEKVKTDTSLQENLNAAKSPEDVVGIAKEYGFEFTADKLTELSEKDLENISGGTLAAAVIIGGGNAVGITFAAGCFE